MNVFERFAWYIFLFDAAGFATAFGWFAASSNIFIPLMIHWVGGFYMSVLIWISVIPAESIWPFTASFMLHGISFFAGLICHFEGVGPMKTGLDKFWHPLWPISWAVEAVVLFVCAYLALRSMRTVLRRLYEDEAVLREKVIGFSNVAFSMSLVVLLLLARGLSGIHGASSMRIQEAFEHVVEGNPAESDVELVNSQALVDGFTSYCSSLVDGLTIVLGSITSIYFFEVEKASTADVFTGKITGAELIVTGGQLMMIGIALLFEGAGSGFYISIYFALWITMLLVTSCIVAQAIFKSSRDIITNEQNGVGHQYIEERKDRAKSKIPFNKVHEQALKEEILVEVRAMIENSQRPEESLTGAKDLCTRTVERASV